MGDQQTPSPMASEGDTSVDAAPTGADQDDAPRDDESVPQEPTPDVDQDQDQQQYGLPEIRGADGEIESHEFEYEWDGADVRIELTPPTMDQQERYENLGEDVDAAELKEIVDRHLEQPDIPPGELTVRETMCYLEGIIRFGMEGGSEFAQEARAELAGRESLGN